jgi:uncharacterized protein (DUF302 family)
MNNIYSENPVFITHRQILLQSRYEEFTAKLESTLHFLNPEYASGVLSNPKKVEQYLQSLEGSAGLIIFNIENHGALLNISSKPRKAKQYVIGNPLIAIQMTVQDIRAALYAPLRMIVYENEHEKVFAEYDLPSSLFGQFGNDKILQVARGLDAKLFQVISICDNQ